MELELLLKEMQPSDEVKNAMQIIVNSHRRRLERKLAELHSPKCKIINFSEYRTKGDQNV